MINKFLSIIAKYISVDMYSNLLHNQVSYVAIEYQKARVTIAEAKKKFDKVRDHTVADFENLKRSTLQLTRDAVVELNESAQDEKDEIEIKYNEAKEKVEQKVQAAVSLSKIVDSIGKEEFPLE